MMKALEGAAAEHNKTRFDSERIAQKNWIFDFEAVIVWLKLSMTYRVVECDMSGMGGNGRRSKVCSHVCHRSANNWKQWIMAVPNRTYLPVSPFSQSTDIESGCVSSFANQMYKGVKYQILSRLFYKYVLTSQVRYSTQEI